MNNGTILLKKHANHIYSQYDINTKEEFCLFLKYFEKNIHYEQIKQIYDNMNIFRPLFFIITGTTIVWNYQTVHYAYVTRKVDWLGRIKLEKIKNIFKENTHES